MSQAVMFIGGPRSGKSNYLFRIWLALERATGRLLKDSLPDDVSYLHEGASALLTGRFAPHTSRDTQHTSIVPVRWKMADKEPGTLIMPDASGELWLELYKQRAWPKTWDDLVTGKTGFVLMICAESPENVIPLDWLTCQRRYGAEQKPLPTSTPTQVMLVDWLQILRSILARKGNGSFSPRLSVVVTAWDRVQADQIYSSPTIYLDTQFPLLAQFLDSNTTGFATKVFGLSILGGDPDADPNFRKHVQLSDPETLGYVRTVSRHGDERTTDVLEPIYWALGVDT